jgi:peptidoglycan-associated lipoprotein
MMSGLLGVFSRREKHTLVSLLGSLLLFGMFFSGCPKQIPTQALKDAQSAIEEARKDLAERCAKDELDAANRLMKQAKALMDEGKYDDARELFAKARMQAEKAREAAQLRKEECLNPPKPRVTQQPEPPTVVPSSDQPMADDRETLAIIYFGFNQYTITPQAGEVLKLHAAWLKRNANSHIEVSGHCDQRGSIEYNLSLGERRALAAKSYLADLGVASNRISIISYGHQRPADPRFTEEAYAKNRRAEFRVTRK